LHAVCDAYLFDVDDRFSDMREELKSDKKDDDER
jgi:hypothetical protein